MKTTLYLTNFFYFFFWIHLSCFSQKSQFNTIGDGVVGLLNSPEVANYFDRCRFCTTKVLHIIDVRSVLQETRLPTWLNKNVVIENDPKLTDSVKSFNLHEMFSNRVGYYVLFTAAIDSCRTSVMLIHPWTNMSLFAEISKKGKKYTFGKIEYTAF